MCSSDLSYPSITGDIGCQVAQMKNSSAVYLKWNTIGGNLLQYPYEDSTKTTNGITFTVNDEGNVSVSGTASADAYFDLASGTLSELKLTAGEKLLVTTLNDNFKIEVTETDSSDNVLSTITGNDPLQYIVPDTENTLTFSVLVPSGSVVSPAETLQPMLYIEDKIEPINDLTISLLPIQSLNGYDSPWPAGGGVNKILPKTEDYTITTGYGISGLWDADTETLTFGGTNTDAVAHGFFSVTASSGYLKYPTNLQAGDTLWFGTNLPSNSYAQIVYSKSGGSLSVLKYINGTGSFNCQSVTIPADFDGIARLDVGVSASATIPSSNANFIVTVGETAPSSWSPYSNLCPITGRTGASAYVGAEHDPDTATEYAVQFLDNSDPLTVYAGTIDLVSGVLTVTHICDTFTKDSSWYGFNTGTGNSSAVVQLSHYDNVKFVEGVSNYNGAISSTGKELQNYWVGARQNEVPSSDNGFAYSSTGQLRFHRTDVANITDLASFKANFPDTQICYELAEPLTFQLSKQQIVALFGQNNFWSDAGTVTLNYTTNMGRKETLSGDIVSFSDSKAVPIPDPVYRPGVLGVEIYRYSQDDPILRRVYSFTGDTNSILDYYAPSQKPVSYLFVAHGSSEDVFVVTDPYTPTFWFYSILLCSQDSNGNYHVEKEYVFKYGVESGAVSNNNEPTLQKNFTPYPNRQPASSLYKTGKVTGYIGTVSGAKVYSDSISLQNAIYAISTSPLTKFIKTRKGDVIMMDTAASISMKTDDNTVQQALKATIDWVEMGDTEGLSIVSVPNDSFWPINS